MASFSLRILFVDGEVKTENDLFPAEKDRFSYTVTPISLSELDRLSPYLLINDYDLVVFDNP